MQNIVMCRLFVKANFQVISISPAKAYERNNWLKSRLFAMEARSDEERLGHPKLKLVKFQSVSIAKTSYQKDDL